jgi:DNA invertase Pin-like site-specific DNA recombinase
MARSVKHAVDTLECLRHWNVGLRSLTEPMIDTTSPWGEMLFNLLATFAQFERALIAERVRAGMARAKRQGKHVGRPLALNGDLDALRPAIEAGTLSRRQAARPLGVTVSTISRLCRERVVRRGPPEAA